MQNMKQNEEYKNIVVQFDLYHLTFPFFNYNTMYLERKSFAYNLSGHCKLTLYVYCTFMILMDEFFCAQDSYS